MLWAVAMSWRRKSFDVLPALSVRGQPLRSSLRLVTAAWMLGPWAADVPLSAAVRAHLDEADPRVRPTMEWLLRRVLEAREATEES